ncbi:hypothetical protein A1O1_02065 [Capronia coronata CBS 617.96]|uniref:Aminoglycoside phosphotransferase domain-containing protein n=1 Tax=Capronia coronata CBS 617.96 TaxID=1182541 RepID=W9YM80_9EURO|nr:uncharacterized protein A1O1_02065 [Capronia coronata CBS 617.96]EXJ93673.1 hypothetical protein A1O1_02065 [Capronia coronata CBS 617.96]
MDTSERWTRGSLDDAFENAQASPSMVFLDLFHRRVFRHEGKVVKYGQSVTVQEAQALSFIKNSSLSIPIPRAHWSGTCENVGVVEMGVIEGDGVWRGLSKDEKHSYMQQLGEIVKQLRSLEGTYIGSLQEGPAVDARRDRHQGGPFYSEAAFNEFLLSNAISTMPQIYRKMIHDLLSAKTHKVVFTPGDLSSRNIMVKDGRIVGIIDWEYAGWYPEYWEFVRFFRAV